MRAGISAPEMVDLTRLAFVEASSKTTRLRNDRVNQAAVAAMTGLTRVEVKKLLGQKAMTPAVIPPTKHWTTRLVDGWRNDPDFTDKNGCPVVLDTGRDTASFSELVRRYSGDMTPRAVRQELGRLGLISAEGTKLTLNSETGVTAQLVVVQKLAVTLQPVLSSLSAAATGTGAIDGLDAEIELSHPLSKKLLARHLKIALPQFIERAKIAANAIRTRPNDRRLTTTEKTTISIVCVNFETKK